jgi:hypothetical protein
VADERESKILVDKQELRQIFFRMEEILAHYRNQHYLIQVRDMHGAEDNLLHPAYEIPEVVIVELGGLWQGECPICGNEYDEVEPTEGAEPAGVCGHCGFQMKWGWEKNYAKIRHWMQHYSANTDHKVDEFADPLSFLRMA